MTQEFSTLFRSKSNDSSVDFVVKSIKELLLTKKVMPGDRLPTEFELGDLLHVSRGSVREAMKILSALGIVEVKRGDGTYVSKQSSEAQFDPLLFSLIVSQPKFAELKELRLILELSVVRLAIHNATEENLNALRNCLNRMVALGNMKEKNYDNLLACDLEFHSLLGKATKNGPLETIYGFVMQYFRTYIEESLHKHSNFSKESVEMHTKILTAIEQGSVRAGKRAVEEAIEIWEELILKA